jgi:hypothetical protein
MVRRTLNVLDLQVQGFTDPEPTIVEKVDDEAADCRL